MTQAGPSTIVIAEKPEPNILIRALWFLALGWWLSALATVAAILLQITIIGIPVAIWVINRIPQLVTLKSSRRLAVRTDEASGVTTIAYADRQQRSFLVRALYYLLVGWWATAIWLVLAWVVAITVLGLPLAFWMYGATGAIQTLRR